MWQYDNFCFDAHLPLQPLPMSCPPDPSEGHTAPTEMPTTLSQESPHLEKSNEVTFLKKKSLSVQEHW